MAQSPHDDEPLSRLPDLRARTPAALSPISDRFDATRSAADARALVAEASPAGKRAVIATRQVTPSLEAVRAGAASAGSGPGRAERTQQLGDRVRRPRQGLGQGEHVARLGERQAALVRDAGGEARGRPLVAGIALLGEDEQHAQRVVELDVLQVGGRGADEHHVLREEGPSEARVRVTLTRHEHMFA